MNNNEDPKVSVIIPTYNYGHFIEEAIKSVLAQTYKNIEIVVIDGMSTDNTKEVLKPYMDHIKYIRKPKEGMVVARTTGINNSTGEYISLLDADDMYAPDKIEEQMTFLKDYPELDFVISDSSEFNGKGITLESFTASKKRFQQLPCKKDGKRRIYTTGLFDAYLRDNFIHPSTMLMKKSHAVENGFMDSRYPVREVYANTINNINNLKIGYVDKVLVYRRCHKMNLSNQWNLIDLTSIKIFKDFLKEKAGTINNDQKKFMYGEIGLGYSAMGQRAFLNGHLNEAKTNLKESFSWPPFRIKAFCYYTLSQIPFINQFLSCTKKLLKKSDKAYFIK